MQDSPESIPSAVTVRKGIVRAYDSASHTADVQIVGSHPTLIAGLRVATNIPPADVVTGRQCTVLFLDPSNQDEAVVLTIQGAFPSVGEILFATATADLTLTTSAQSIVGDGDGGKVRIILPTIGDWVVEAVCDFEVSATDPDRCIGQLFVDDSGSAQYGAAVFGEGQVNRATVPARWKITTAVADTPVELKAKKTTAAGTAKALAANTTLAASGVKRSTGGGGGSGTLEVQEDTVKEGDASILDFTEPDADAVAFADPKATVNLSIYALLGGRSGGQALKGGTGSGDDLELESTTHATKGNVRIADGSPFECLNKFGNVIGQGMGTPAAMLRIKNQLWPESEGSKSGILVDPQWVASADNLQYVGISGFMNINAQGRTGTKFYGLDFVAAIYGGGALDVVACRAKTYQIPTPAATITNFESYRADMFAGTGLSAQNIVAYRSVIGGHSGGVNVIGLKIDDITLGANKYLIEVGPSTPNLRVEAGVPATPGSGEQSNVLIAFTNSGGGVTLRRLHTKPGNTLVAGDNAVVAV